MPLGNRTDRNLLDCNYASLEKQHARRPVGNLSCESRTPVEERRRIDLSIIRHGRRAIVLADRCTAWYFILETLTVVDAMFEERRAGLAGNNKAASLRSRNGKAETYNNIIAVGGDGST